MMDGYNKFKDFVQNSTITNDPAERGVAILSEFRATFQQENLCQSNLVAVSESRKLMPRDKSKADKAEKMKKLCKL